MLSLLYLLYHHIEGCISFGLIAYMLYCLCGAKKDSLKPRKYVLISTACFYVVYQLLCILFQTAPDLKPSY